MRSLGAAGDRGGLCHGHGRHVAMKQTALLIFSVLASGCVGGAADEPARETARSHSLEVILAGTLLWRIPGHGVVGCDLAEPSEGDRIGFSLVMPPASRRLSATFEWTTPQPMTLSFYAPGDEFPDHSTSDALGPLELAADDPIEGEWEVYAGPSYASGATDWTLVLRWEGQAEIQEEDLRIAPCE